MSPLILDRWLSLEFSFSPWNQEDLLVEVWLLLPAAWDAYQAGAQPCLLCRQIWCRRMSALVIQGSAQPASSPLLTCFFQSVTELHFLSTRYVQFTLCFGPHRLLFLECPSIWPQVLPTLKDGQSPATFRKPFPIHRQNGSSSARMIHLVPNSQYGISPFPAVIS